MDMERPFSTLASASAPAPTPVQLRIDRRNERFRQQIDAAIDRQHRGWLTGEPGGLPWTLSWSKRLSSMLLAACILLLISPLLLLIAALIKLGSPGPVF